MPAPGNFQESAGKVDGELTSARLNRNLSVPSMHLTLLGKVIDR
ncbi:MAG: hypothetical protein ACK5RR_12680 [Acidobacteriota bacterium]|jgi:hypothetical protein